MKNKKLLIGVIVYVGLILLCLLVVYAIPSIRGMLVKTYLAEQGEINLSNETEAYLVRDEKVYVAKNAADIERVAKPGKLYKASSAIVKYSDNGLADEKGRYNQVLTKLGEDVMLSEHGGCRYAGYVEYQIDGNETSMTPAVVTELRFKQLKAAGGDGLVETAKGRCAAGDPVFKIVRNGKYYMIFYLKNEDATHYCEGNAVTVTVNKENITASICDIQKSKAYTRVILKCGMMYDGCLTDRKAKVTITTSGAKGLLIKDKSLVEKDGQKGVIVKDKMGEYGFKPIRIKADDGESSVVYQDIYMDDMNNFVKTLSIYDEIVENPSDKDVKESY